MKNDQEQFLFTKESPFMVIRQREHQVLNFQNMHSLYFFKKTKTFRNEILKDHNVNFPDGRPLSIHLGIKQKRGPSFTRDFLLSNHAKDKRHFFIGSGSSEELSQTVNISQKNLFFYNPPFLEGTHVFSEDERIKIASLVKNFGAHYVWVCIGNPKQEILSNQLYDLHPATYVNVGAALDFILGKKKESPPLFRTLGVESVYRLLTDFRYTHKKFWKSLIAVRYLKHVNVEKK